MATPDVSVLMPVRNADVTLASTLSSLQRQRAVSWECIAVDDGSTDETPELLERAAGDDERVTVVTRKPSGIVESLNRGLELCRGRYVARMDADDLMHRDRLRLQATLLSETPELSGVGCHVRLFPRRHLGRGRRDYEQWLNSLQSADDVERDALVECPLAHPTMMLRREVLEQYRYRDSGWPEDYDLVLRLTANGHRLGVVPRRLLHWRDGADRLSRTSPTYGIDRFTRCKAHFISEGFLASRSNYVLWGYGNTGRHLARALLDRGKRPCLIVEVHPGRVGQKILGAPVVPPEALPDFRGRHPEARVLVSVARAGPRSEVRDALAGMGFRELLDYVCTA